MPISAVGAQMLVACKLREREGCGEDARETCPEPCRTLAIDLRRDRTLLLLCP